MAGTKVKTGRGAGRLPDTETGELWTEIDVTDPKQKAVVRAAKAFYTESAARAQVLKENKAKVDGLQAKLIELMAAANLKKFRFQGLIVEICDGPKKADVKLEAPEDEDEKDD